MQYFTGCEIPNLGLELRWYLERVIVSNWRQPATIRSDFNKGYICRMVSLYATFSLYIPYFDCIISSRGKEFTKGMKVNRSNRIFMAEKGSNDWIINLMRVPFCCSRSHNFIVPVKDPATRISSFQSRVTAWMGLLEGMFWLNIKYKINIYTSKGVGLFVVHRHTFSAAETIIRPEFFEMKSEFMSVEWAGISDLISIIWL
jgi:hypothetical protein